MMFYDFMRKLTAEQSHDNLLEAFGDQAPSKRTVERWYLEFKRDRTSLQDEPRSGRPSTVVTPDTVATVGSLIREDSRITFEHCWDPRHRKMVAAFFCKVGPVAIIPLEDRRTVNVVHQPLSSPSLRGLEFAPPKTGIRGLLLHHDNASAHTASKTLDFLAENSVQLVSHPPYSPDLVPCDFFLFPNVKE